MKKTVILALLVLASVANLQAQPKSVERTLQVPASNKVELQLKFGDNIKITAWDKKEASVKATYEINGGRLNDVVLLEFESDDKSARVKMDLDYEILKAGKLEDCPQNGAESTLYIESTKDVSFICKNIDYEIFVPRNADLTVETTDGNIELKGLTGPVEAKSISGFVDMNWPQYQGAVVSLQTTSGKIYSDMDLVLPNKGKAPVAGHQLKGKVNEGGSSINLESISNDIYFRKQE
ncbi:hypothetical protein [Pontibacter harenae]|uniref:hypothetical protein n=1 Tax=Pontibacter harenae TaxID=2894083 RepID=UPI001E5B897F|nr:hypothetical protein [Pontibacter harenae]MCC9167995.1 hypothetical protein [Pontibacter harenae]